MPRLSRLCLALALLSSPPPARAAEGDALEAPSPLDDWSVIPFVFYTPETSVGFGAAVIYGFDASNGTAASLSTLAAGVIVTTEEQIIARLEPDLRFEDVFLHGVLRFQRYPTRFFGPGAHLGDEGEAYDEAGLWTNLDARYRVGPQGHPWEAVSVGGRCDVQWSEVLEVADGGLLDVRDPLGVSPWAGVGCGPLVAIDSRDDVRLPHRGIYAEARLTGWTRLYGRPFTALVGDLDLRGFLDLGRDHVLGGQLRVSTAAGDLPFQLLPKIGGSMQHRGWFEGHMRDQNVVLLQLEWRFPIVGKLGGAVFTSVGEAFRRWSDLDVDGLRFAGGGGVRWLVNKKQTVTVRADVAWGSDLAVYVDVLESF